MKHIFSILFFSIFLNLNAKNSTDELVHCATPSPTNEWESELQRLINFQKNLRTIAIDTPIYIPVIFHILHTGQAVGNSYNISSTNIQQQIETLNADFNGYGYGSTNIPAPFQAAKASTGIHFCLATKSISGSTLAEPGIDRVDMRGKGFYTGVFRGFIPSELDQNVKPTTSWDPNYYLNIWVTDLKSLQGTLRVDGLLGYAYLPAFSTLSGVGPEYNGVNPNVDGVAMDYLTVGGSPNKGRTATHEIGHWLGLRHIWGDNGQCNGDDYCNDTPKQYGGTASPAGANFGCPSYPFNANLCESNPFGDMFMNFMDYTNDNCMKLFTNDQKTRMITALTNSPLRMNVIKSPACASGTPKPVAKMLSSATGVCTGQSISFSDRSIFGPTSFNWIFEGGTPATSTSLNPTITYNGAPGKYDVTLIVTNSGGSDTLKLLDYITVIPVQSLPFSENFESNIFPDNNMSLLTRNTRNENWKPILNNSLPNSNKCIYFDNTNIDVTGFKDDIRTPKLNFVGSVSPKLSFQYAHSQYPDLAYQDTLEVLVSLDCGVTYSRIFYKGGNDLATAVPDSSEWFPTDTTEWRKETINLSAFNGQPQVMVVFRNIAKFGHSIYIDNVNISDIVSTPPVASFTETALTVCAGQSITFTSTSTNSPSSVSWTFGGGGTPNTSSATNPTISFNTAGTYTVQLTATNTAGNNSTSKQVIVKTKPNVTSNSPTICAGQSTTLTGTGATTYSWNTGGATAAITVSPAATTTYTVIGTTNGCTDTSTSTVTVNTKPTADAGVDKTISCSTTSVQLGSAATAGATYTWTPAAGLSNAGVAQPNATAAGTYTVIVNITATSCSDTDVVVVSANTTAPTANAGTDKTINCTTTSTQIGTAAVAGNTYSWTPATGLSNAAIAQPSATAAGTYTVTVTNTANGCTATDQVIVTNSATLPPADAGTDKTITCTTSSATIGAVAVAGNTYSWTPATGLNNAGIAQPTATAAGTYTLTVTNTATGCTNTDVVVVSANNTAPTVNATGATICSGQSAQISATGSGSGYSWTGPGIVSGGTTATPTINAAGTYTVTNTNTSNGCTATATAVVTLNNSVPTITVNSPAICAGQSATLTASGANTYTWSTGAITASITVSPTTTTTYTVVGSTGCNNGNGSGTVTVNALPTVGVNNVSGCPGSSQTLTATGATTYSWSNGASGSSINVTVGSSNSTVTVTGTTTGCNGSATANITALAVPATPNISRADSVLTCTVTAASYQWYRNGTLISGATAQTYKMTQNGSYTVVVKNSDNCEATSTALNIVNLPVRNNSSISGIQIIPNPNKGVFAVQLQSDKNTSAVVEMYSVNGQQVMSQVWQINAGQNTYNIANESIADGVYFMNIRNEDGNTSIRIVVQR